MSNGVSERQADVLDGPAKTCEGAGPNPAVAAGELSAREAVRRAVGELCSLHRNLGHAEMRNGCSNSFLSGGECVG
jgi:hypothetical protein